MKTSNGRIQWQNEKGFWSGWYDFDDPELKKYLENEKVIACEIRETMTKTEYEARYGANNVKSTNPRA